MSAENLAVGGRQPNVWKGFDLIYPKIASGGTPDLTSLNKREKEQLKTCLIQVFAEYCCSEGALPLRKVILQLEKAVIKSALTRFNGHLGFASRRLGTKYTTFYEKLKRHDITFEKRPV